MPEGLRDQCVCRQCEQERRRILRDADSQPVGTAKAGTSGGHRFAAEPGCVALDSQSIAARFYTVLNQEVRAGVERHPFPIVRRWGRVQHLGDPAMRDRARHV